MPLTTIGGRRITLSSIPEDRLINPYVNIGGDTMSGTLTLPSDGLRVGSNQLYVTSDNGNVRIGIGTNSPTSALQVAGTITAAGLSLTNPISFNEVILSYGTATSAAVRFTDESTGLYRVSSGVLGFVSSGSTTLTISTLDFVNYANKYSYIRNSVSESAISYDSLTDTLLFGSGTSNISFSTSGSSGRLYINSNGNIGIKTLSSDLYALNVNGRVNSSYGYSGLLITDVPGVSSNPSNGQLLIGNGTSSWSVSNLEAGTGISIVNSAGGIKISLGIGISSTVGVTTLTGSANQIYTNSPVGDVVLSLPQDININSNVLFNSVKTNKSTFSTVDFTTTSTDQIVLDQFLSADYRTAKYIVQVKNTDNSYYEVSELLVTHDGTTAYVTQYAIVKSGPYLTSFEADLYTEILDQNVRLLLTPTYSNNKIRVQRILLDRFD